LNEVLQKAGDAYKAQLKASPRAIDYLKRRGLSGQIAKTYGLGYAPEGWRFLSTVFPDYQSALLVESGLVIAHHTEEASAAASTAASEPQEQRRYDRFRDRVMFPIRNVKGECIGFGGRVLDKGEPKYLNSPETPVFSKGHELYGLFEARSAIRQVGYVLVTEGYMDVVALAQLGFGNAVATLGTACTADHVRLLFRFSDAVVFSFDGDAAGRRAAHKALEASLPWASDTRSVKFLFLPPEHDPDSFVREQGTEAFAQAVKTAQPLSRFLLDAAAAGCDLETAEGRALMASQAQPLWSAMPDGALKRQLLGELADGVGLDPRELAGLWQSGGQRRAAVPRAKRTAEAAPPVEAQGTDPRTAVTASSRSAQPNDWPAQGVRSPYALRAQRSRSKGLLGRGDRVARIVLSAPQAWDWLTADDHQMLSHEPPPHGPLFAWLESQWHEHGPQPWAALRVALRNEPFEPLALELHASGVALERTHTADAPPDADSPTEQDLRRELRELLRRMHIERLKLRETELVTRVQTDPLALALYREAQLARRRLENEQEGAAD
jgi:DNA primase